MYARRLLQGASLRLSERAGIGEGRHAANPGHGFDQDVLSLAVKLSCENADPRRVAIWPRERSHQPFPDHIVCDRNDGDALGCLLYGTSRNTPTSIDDIGLGCDQLRRILRNQIDARYKNMPLK